MTHFKRKLSHGCPKPPLTQTWLQYLLFNRPRRTLTHSKTVLPDNLRHLEPNSKQQKQLHSLHPKPLPQPEQHRGKIQKTWLAQAIPNPHITVVVIPTTPTPRARTSPTTARPPASARAATSSAKPPRRCPGSTTPPRRLAVRLPPPQSAKPPQCSHSPQNAD